MKSRPVPHVLASPMSAGTRRHYRRPAPYTIAIHRLQCVPYAPLTSPAPSRRSLCRAACRVTASPLLLSIQRLPDELGTKAVRAATGRRRHRRVAGISHHPLVIATGADPTTFAHRGSSLLASRLTAAILTCHRLRHCRFLRACYDYIIRMTIKYVKGDFTGADTRLSEAC
jgi:hypothetical protein